MYFMDLQSIEEEMSVVIDFDLGEIEDYDSVEEIGSLCEDVTRHYRSRAICRLLTNGDSDGYYHDLMRSAKTRRYYLSRCHEEGYLETYRIMASISEPFFDALAAGQFDVARDIADLSAQEWWPEDEYEDDYCYARFIHLYVRDNADIDELNEILRQFETFLQGEASARLDVCKALLSRSPNVFRTAFHQLIDTRRAQIEFEQDTPLGVDMGFQTERHLFIEGLALLRMAEKAGLPTEREYLFCPSIARLSMRQSFPDDGYPR